MKQGVLNYPRRGYSCCHLDGERNLKHGVFTSKLIDYKVD